MHLASLSRIIKFNRQKLFLKRVEIISINSSVGVNMWMIQITSAVIESDWTYLGEDFTARCVETSSRFYCNIYFEMLEQATDYSIS